MHLHPYLHFNGCCEEAIEFYKSAVPAKVSFLMRFKESPELPPGGANPAIADKVLHATLTIGNSILQVSDGRCSGETKFDGFCLSISTPSEEEAKRIFASLSDGAKVFMPLGKTFFSPCFGMLTDKFGVSWMVIVQA